MMNNLKQIKGVIIGVGLLVLSLFMYKKGEESNEIKHLKKDKKADEEDQRLADNISSLSDSDINNRLQ